MLLFIIFPFGELTRFASQKKKTKEKIQIQRRKTKMTKIVYEIVTNKIIEKLEQGTVPWQKPWVNGNSAVNWKTQKQYRGINTMLLDPGEYVTFKQAQEANAKIKKGAKSEIVVFWKWIETENKDTGKEEKVPLLRYYRNDKSL